MTSKSTLTLGGVLSELREHSTQLANRCRVSGWFGALFHVGVQGHILADVSAAQQQVADTAHKAETYDIEAMRAIDEAQKPDSEGGAVITLAEAKRIRAFVAKSAQLDHDASEMVTA